MRLPRPAARLRLPALGLLGALILGVGLLAWALDLRDRQHDQLLAAQAEESRAAQAARLAPERLELAQASAGLHAEMQGRGFLGPEQRAGWVTALGKARLALDLDSLSWRLPPRQPGDLAPGLFVSAMELTASPIDAAGLEALFERLRSEAPGRFTVARCALNLSPGSAAGLAECRLNWWTWDHGP